MSDHVKKGMLLEFVDLGVGVILEIRAAREPVFGDDRRKHKFLCKSSYVLDVLVGDTPHEINVSVHWYHPAGDPQGWWSYSLDHPKHREKQGWYGVNWL